MHAMKDTVEVHHPDFDASITKWARCRDCIMGEDAVKGAGSTYLPKLFGQTEEEYNAYRNRGLFFGATQRTVHGLTGAVMRRPPAVTPEDLASLNKRIGSGGETISDLASIIVSEVLSTGRCGVLVDAGEQENSAPSLSIYRAEDITNWRVYEEADGRERFSMVVLRETVVEEAGVFLNATIQQFRVLIKTAGGCETQIYRRSTTSDGLGKFMLYKTIKPTKIGGMRLSEIPFIIINSEGLGAAVGKPPLLDLVAVNLSHYRTSVDLEHGRHFTALPTPWIAGFDPEQTFTIGSARAWVARNPGANAGYLEFSGAGLSELREALREKEVAMAVLGARMLEEQKAASETASAVRLRQAGEQCVLSRIASYVSSGLSIALGWWVGWQKPGSSLSAEAQVVLNSEFGVAGMDSAQLSSLITAVQGGLISWDSFFQQMKRADLVPSERTPEEERALIEMGTPLGLPDEQKTSSARSGSTNEDEDEDDEEDPDKGGPKGS